MRYKFTKIVMIIVTLLMGCLSINSKDIYAAALGQEWKNEIDPASVILENIMVNLRGKLVTMGVTCTGSDVIYGNYETYDIISGEDMSIRMDGLLVEDGSITVSVSWKKETCSLQSVKCTIYSESLCSNKNQIDELMKAVYSQQIVEGLDIAYKDCFDAENSVLVDNMLVKYVDNNFNVQYEENGFFMNLLMILPQAVCEEDGIFYFVEENAAIACFFEKVPMIIPENLGGYPLLRINVEALPTNDVAESVLAVPGTVSEIGGFTEAGIVFLPKSLKIMDYGFVNSMNGTMFCYSSDIELTGTNNEFISGKFVTYATSGLGKLVINTDSSCFIDIEMWINEVVASIKNQLEDENLKKILQSAIMEEIPIGDYSHLSEVMEHL